ncbi:MAG: NUDIX domain-containing protein [Pseudorhodobacter sp.]|nr:NUDIX domain-containing protein [Pseudorhodobacter sp.]
MGRAALALMADFFFYGTLCHAPLLQVVLGRRVGAEPALLAGYEVRSARGPDGGKPFPLLCAGGAGAPGVLVRGLSEADAARLDYYEAGFAFHIREVEVQGQSGPVAARVYFADAGRWLEGPQWRLADWAAEWGEIVTEAARDFMAGMGRIGAEAALARYPSMLARAASRLRAGKGGAAGLRRRPVPGDLEVQAVAVPYARFFALEEYRLRHRRFDGAMTPPLDRVAFVSTDAVVVLPYDPIRDRVLVVEQFRTGAFARGDTNPWLLEPVAGRIDAGETPAEAARRETAEEAALRVDTLIAGPDYYPSPGAKTEFVYSFVALADLPDSAARLGGLEHEGEDIRAHVLGFAEAEALMASGEIATATLLVLLMWLAPRRARLQAEARAGAGARLGV